MEWKTYIIYSNKSRAQLPFIIFALLIAIPEWNFAYT